MNANDALDNLECSALLWLSGARNFDEVVLEACAVLVAGGEGDALATLAGAAPREPVHVEDMVDLIQSALAEQGRPLPPRHTREAQARFVGAMARHALAGRISPRDLAEWAHRAVGHEGVALAQPLVDLDDRYDTVDYSDDDVDALDREVLAFCTAVAASA